MPMMAVVQAMMRTPEASAEANFLTTSCRPIELTLAISMMVAQPDTPAKPKGLFGMALKTADSRTEKQKIGKGKEITLRTREKNTNKFLCSVKKGELILVDEHLRISGLREGQIAEVWLRIGEYVAKTKKGYTRYNYPRVTAHGRAGGGDAHVAIPLVDKVGIGPKHGGDLRIYVVVKNVSGDECVVEYTKHHVLAD